MSAPEPSASPPFAHETALAGGEPSAMRESGPSRPGYIPESELAKGAKR